MKIDQLKEAVARFKKSQAPTDIVGLDVGSSGVSAVRMRKTDAEATVLCADMLPPLSATAPREGEAAHAAPLTIPPKLKARYASLATAGESCFIKLLSFPQHFDDAAAAKIVENLGLDDPSKYRVSYKVLPESPAKEARVLAVALAEEEARSLPALLPIGIPAPCSIEISGLATMTAFLHTAGAKHKDEAVGVIDFGESVTSFALFNKGLLALIRRFTFGAATLLNKVRETLGVDAETAEGIIADGAFDISQAVSEVLDPVVKQLIVSRDFVERRENCRISKLFASGGLVVSHDSIEEMGSAMGVPVEMWSPFEGLAAQPNAVPENFRGQEWRFSAAVGACLATLEEA